jgi:hypothetical protein
MVIPWRDWLASQLRFLSGHRYFSPAARALREAGKLSNIRLLERLLEEGSGPEYASDEADASA